MRHSTFKKMEEEKEEERGELGWFMSIGEK
jgi:hypothetical protein